MSAALPSSTGTSSRRNILLVEEYDALAVAFGSALKKFAPNDGLAIAATLTEASSKADAISPELFVIDFDPPQAEAVAFFNHLRALHPRARVLVIVAGQARDFAEMRGAFGAVQFIKKPFEVADFGAAVQALLGPWTEAGSENSRGTIGDFEALDAIALYCLANTTIGLSIRNDKVGRIDIIDGQIVAATAEELSGPAALKDILAWPETRVREIEMTAPPQRNIHGPWTAVLREALQKSKRRAKSPAEPIAAPKKPAAPKSGRKLLVIDDTDMLLIFVEDSLAIADPNLRIETSRTGEEGCEAAERFLPDLVLLDYSLPGIRGDEVCRRLQKNPATARIPVLMMSGHVPEMMAAAAHLPNVVATLPKPFLSEELIALVKQTLARDLSAREELREERREETAPPPPKTVDPPKAAAPPPKIVDPIEEPPPSPPPPPPLPPISAVAASTNGNGSRAAHAPAPVTPEPLAAPAVERPVPVSFPRPTANDVVLGLPLEVVAMQFTPLLQMGAIRAKPSSFTVSLQVPAALEGALPFRTAFKLGGVKLDAKGQLATVQLIPTQDIYEPAQSRNTFSIGGVTVVPANERERLQLVSASAAPMTMQLLAHFELASVKLTPAFEVAHLELACRTNSVRVTLSSRGVSGENGGATFATAGIELDDAARISELVLQPLG